MAIYFGTRGDLTINDDDDDNYSSRYDHISDDEKVGFRHMKSWAMNYVCNRVPMILNSTTNRKMINESNDEFPPEIEQCCQ